MKSSNYPGNYSDNEYCTWQIQVPVNKKIRLDFTEFKTETGKDYLLIYDTNHYQTPTIVFDGTTYKPPPFTSSGNVVRVRFISDGATTRRGFSFNYQQVGKRKLEIEIVNIEINGFCTVLSLFVSYFSPFVNSTSPYLSSHLSNKYFS